MSIEDTNYYQVLQVDPTVDQVDIDASYRRLARLYHPDRNESAFATTFMQELNVAYSVLRDPKRRLDYDMQIDLDSATARYAKRGRAKSLHRWLVVPACIAFFSLIFVILINPSTRIGSSSAPAGIVNANDMRQVPAATKIAEQLAEAARIASPSVESPKSIVQSVADSLNSDSQPQEPTTSGQSQSQSQDGNMKQAATTDNVIAADSAATDESTADSDVGKDVDDTAQTSAVVNGQTVAVQPTATLIVATATQAATLPPTATSSTAASISVGADTAAQGTTPTVVATFTSTPESANDDTVAIGPTGGPTVTPSALTTNASSADASASLTEVAELFRGMIVQDTSLYREPRVTTPVATVYSGNSLQTVAMTSDGMWYRLDNGYWIEAKFVAREGSDEPMAVPTSAPTVTRSLNLDFPWRGAAARDANLYLVPGDSTAIAASVFEGTTIVVVGVSGDGKWYQLNDDFWISIDSVTAQ